MWAALGDGEEAFGDVDDGFHVAERQALAAWLVNGERGAARAPDAGPIRWRVDVDVGEVGADHGFVEVSGDGTVAFDAHDDVDVGEAVADLAGAGHLAGQVVLGDGVLERVAFGTWSRR